jgi:hypothetical protein
LLPFRPDGVVAGLLGVVAVCPEMLPSARSCCPSA